MQAFDGKELVAPNFKSIILNVLNGRGVCTSMFEAFRAEMGNPASLRHRKFSMNMVDLRQGLGKDSYRRLEKWSTDKRKAEQISLTHKAAVINKGDNIKVYLIYSIQVLGLGQTAGEL